MDAGSIGSRIHIYEFETLQGDATPKLLSETFELMRPGLSHYVDNPMHAADSIDQLLQLALRKVPSHLHSKTPITLKATAGLRLLGQEASKNILDQVQTHIADKYPFKLPLEGGVSILDGKDEAVYAWITTNFLLGNLNGSNVLKEKPTAAIFDLGGASTQIVFQPGGRRNPEGALDATMDWDHDDHKYNLEIANSRYSLYQHSHLGYGLMEARKKVHQLVVQKYLQENGNNFTPVEVIVNPCIASGLSRTISVDTSFLGLNGGYVNITMVGPGHANPAECLGLTTEILNIDKPCHIEPCSFNGIFQPPIPEIIEKEELYIFSFFYDRMAPLGLPRFFSLFELRDVIRAVCSGPAHWPKAFRDTANDFSSLYDELYGRPEWCLDLSFMLSMLHDGYGIPMNRNVTVEKQVNGHELGWCLGASLFLLQL